MRRSRGFENSLPTTQICTKYNKTQQETDNKANNNIDNFFSHRYVFKII